MNKELSDSDIYNLLHNKTKVLLYNEIKKYPTVEKLLGRYGNCVILYPASSTHQGHWTCLFYGVDDNGKRNVEFFDSYGLSIDLEKEFSHVKQPPYLSMLLLKAADKYPIEFNDHKFQQKGNHINTCGRHCVVRLMNRHMPLKQYIKKFRSTPSMSSDRLVTKITTDMEKRKERQPILRQTIKRNNGAFSL